MRLKYCEVQQGGGSEGGEEHQETVSGRSLGARPLLHFLLTAVPRSASTSCLTRTYFVKIFECAEIFEHAQNFECTKIFKTFWHIQKFQQCSKNLKTFWHIQKFQHIPKF